MLTKCPSCDRQIPADGKLCPYCGKRLKRSPSPFLACWEMLRGRRPVTWAGIAIATSFFVFSLACVLCVLVWGFAPKNSTKPASQFPEISTRTPRPTAATQPTTSTITTETTKGTLTIPGPAYMDGRDLDAADPVTVMTINIWDAPDRSTIVCRLEHGEEITLLAAQKNEDEGLYYFKVKSSPCEGWVSEPFVSSEYHEPEGKQLQ